MEENDPFILFFQELPRLRRPVIDRGILENMEEDIVEEMPGVMMRIGLNDTRLTRALLRGQYLLAEEIIEETTDIDFLNDGALNATPLNIVLSGPAGQYQQPRHLRLARLLLLKGANPNIRIPNHDLESASESPLELILRYYLKLLEVFTIGGNLGQIKENYYTTLETELMDSIGINGEYGGLTPRIMVEHTRDLLYLCLESGGGDPNLPTTDAARTIFHLALIAPVPDTQLIQRLLEMGANVNHADVHNTTPLMDLILMSDEQRIEQEMRRLEDHGQIAMLDNQNCTLQSALFRAAFQGKIQTALALMELGAKPALCARTQQEHGFRSYLVNHIVYTGTPPLLAPLLGNSPCWWRHTSIQSPSSATIRPGAIAASYTAARASSRSRASTAGGGGSTSKMSGGAGNSNIRFKASVADRVIRESVSPLVDHSDGKMLVDSVAQSLFHLIRCLTQHKHIADVNKLDPRSAVCMMFGQTTAGLRQLAVRAIMKRILFGSSRQPAQMIDLLKENCVKHGYTPFLLSVTPSFGADVQQQDRNIVHEFMLEPDSELEVSMEHASHNNTNNRRRHDNQERDIDRLLQEMGLDQAFAPPQTLPFNDRPDGSLYNHQPMARPDVSSSLPAHSAINDSLEQQAQAVSATDDIRSQLHLNQPARKAAVNVENLESPASRARDDFEHDSFRDNSQEEDTSSNQAGQAKNGFAEQISSSSTSLSVSRSCDNSNNIPVSQVKLGPVILQQPGVEEDQGDGQIQGACGGVEKGAQPAHFPPQHSQFCPLKSFADLRGLSQEDINTGKRLLLIQMLQSMDPSSLSPEDHQLIKLNPNVEEQLMALSNKLQLEQVEDGNEIANTTPPQVVPTDSSMVRQSNSFCDNLYLEHKSMENFGSKDDNHLLFDGLIPKQSEGEGDEGRVLLEIKLAPTPPSSNNTHNPMDTNRMQLDENWSLGFIKNLEEPNSCQKSLEPHASAKNLTMEPSAPHSDGVVAIPTPDPSAALGPQPGPSSINNVKLSHSTSWSPLQGVTHSVEIVKSLDVNVTVAVPHDTDPGKGGEGREGDDVGTDGYDDSSVLMVYKDRSEGSRLMNDSSDADEYVSPSPVLTDDEYEQGNISFLSQQLHYARAHAASPAETAEAGDNIEDGATVLVEMMLQQQDNDIVNGTNETNTRNSGITNRMSMLSRLMSAASVAAGNAAAGLTSAAAGTTLSLLTDESSSSSSSDEMEDDFTNSTRFSRRNRRQRRHSQLRRRFDHSSPPRAFIATATSTNSAATGAVQINSEIPDLLVDTSDSDSDSMYEGVGAVGGGGGRERGVATLKHTCCRTDEQAQPGAAGGDQECDDGAVISYLSAQVLDALTAELGIPASLRTCFSLEAARLQLAMILASNHAIHCDRNCEGDDSDDDNDDDLGDDNLALHSDTESDSHGIPARYRDQSTPVMSSASSTSSSTSFNHSLTTSPSMASSSSEPTTSHFSSMPASVRSNFGSAPSTVDGVVALVGISAPLGGGDGDADGDEFGASNQESQRDDASSVSGPTVGDARRDGIIHEAQIADLTESLEEGSPADGGHVGEVEPDGIIASGGQGGTGERDGEEGWESASSNSDWLPSDQRNVDGGGVRRRRRGGWLSQEVSQRLASRSWLQQRHLATTSWLEDSENPIRRFLADSPLPPDWYYSTSSSESEHN